MSELVEKQGVIEAIEYGITYAKVINIETGEKMELFREGNDELRKAIERVDRLPEVDAVPVRHGKWELVSQGVWGGYFVCTRCNHRALLSTEDGTEELSPFCPNCGARMEADHE